MVPVAAIPHPLIDAVGAGAETSWVVTESRASVIFVGPGRVNLLTAAARDGRRVVLVTDELSRLTPLFADLWRTAGAAWVVRDGRGGLREGFSGRRLGEVADVWSTTPIRTLDDVAVNYLRPPGVDAVEVFATASMRLPARRGTLLGDALTRLSEAMLGAPPRAWGLGEPVGSPWDPTAVTAYVRDRMPAATTVCVGAPDLTASLEAVRTRHGIEEVTSAHFALAERTERRLAEAVDRVEVALTRLTETAMPLIAFVLARPARRDLLQGPFLAPPPTPLMLLVGPPGVRSLGLDPAALRERFGARIVGRPKIPGLLFPLGLEGSAAWRRLDDILGSFPPAVDELLGPAWASVARHRPSADHAASGGADVQP